MTEIVESSLRDAEGLSVPVTSSGLRTKNLLSIGDLSSDEVTLILDTAEAMKEVGTRSIKKVPALRGQTVVNLFFEASTRTRISFEIAEKRLSADTVNIGVSGSSVVKGETLIDTVLNLEAMKPDLIVVRHGSAGAGHLVARFCQARVINAGDGMHEHPTQALLDALTIRQHKNRFDGLKVAIIGDLLHSRVFRSNISLLKTMGADIWVCGPRPLIPLGIDDLKPALCWAEEIEKLLVIQDRDQKAKDLDSELQRMPIEKDQASLRLTKVKESVSNVEGSIMENEVAMKAGTCAEVLRSEAPKGLEVMGPAQAPLARIRNSYRWQVILKSVSPRLLREGTQTARRHFGRKRAAVALDIDIDPVSML